MQGIFGERERAHNDCICTSHPSLLNLRTTKIRERYIQPRSIAQRIPAGVLARFRKDMTARQRVKISAFTQATLIQMSLFLLRSLTMFSFPLSSTKKGTFSGLILHDCESTTQAYTHVYMFSDKKKRVILTHAHLHDVLTVVYKNRAIRTTRLSRSRSPINRNIGPLRRLGWLSPARQIFFIFV